MKESESPLVGKRIAEIPLPEGTPLENLLRSVGSDPSEAAAAGRRVLIPRPSREALEFPGVRLWTSWWMLGGLHWLRDARTGTTEFFPSAPPPADPAAWAPELGRVFHLAECGDRGGAVAAVADLRSRLLSDDPDPELLKSGEGRYPVRGPGFAGWLAHPPDPGSALRLDPGHVHERVLRPLAAAAVRQA